MMAFVIRAESGAESSPMLWIATIQPFGGSGKKALVRARYAS
jgi:hypothetical protein